MATYVNLNKLEQALSTQMNVAAYHVEFSLTDTQGQMGFVSNIQAREPRSYSVGTITVEVPVEQATEAEVFAKAREILHAALTRLAEATQPPK